MKNLRFRHLTAVLLTFILVLSSSWVTVFAGGSTALSSSATGNADAVINDLSPGKAVPVKSKGESLWYSFTPSSTGRYRIFSFDIEDGDPSVKLFDSSWKLVAANNDGFFADETADTDNFNLSWKLEGGKTYYYQIGEADEEEAFEYSFELESAELKITSLKIDPIVLTAENQDEEGLYDPTPNHIYMTANGRSFSGSLDLVLDWIKELTGEEFEDYGWNAGDTPLSQWKDGNTYQVEYYFGSVKYVYNVTIKKDAKTVESIKLDKESITLEYGDTAIISAEAFPADAVNSKIYWKSDDPEIVSVDSDGKITALDTGDVSITAYTSNDVEAYCEVEVKSADLANAVITVKNITYAGKKATPEPVVNLKGKTLQKDEDYLVTYEQNSKPGKAYVVISGVEDNDYYQGTCKKEFTILKGSQSPKISAARKTQVIKFSKLKKKKQTKNVISVSNAKSKLQYKIKSVKKKKFKKYFRINKNTGKLTIKKGLKKGTYTLRVTVKAVEDAYYKGASKTVKFKVKVK